MNTALAPAPTAKTIARAEDASRRLAAPGRINIDGSGVRVIARRIDTYANDRLETVWPMQKVLEAVAAKTHDVTFWWIDQNDQTEMVDYERFMNLADNLSGAFA